MTATRICNVAVVGLAIALAACGAQPQHAETRIQRSPQIVVVGGPVGAVVTVDNAKVWQLQGGKSDRFEISQGTHRIEVSFGGAILYARDVFIQGQTQKIITLR